MLKIQNKSSASKNDNKLCYKGIITYYFILFLLLLIINFITINSIYLCVFISCFFMLFIIIIDNKFYINILKYYNESKLMNSFFDLILINKNKYNGKELINVSFNELNQNIEEFKNEKYVIICKAINKNISTLALIKIINLLKMDNKTINKDIKLINYMRYTLLFIIVNTVFLIYIHPAFSLFFELQYGFIIILFIYLVFLLLYLILSRFLYLKNNSYYTYLIYFKCLCLINNPLDEFDDFCLILNKFGESIYSIKKAIIEKNDDYIIRFISERKKDKDLIIYIINVLKENKYIEEMHLFTNNVYDEAYIVKIFILFYLLSIIFIYLYEVIYT